MPTNFGKDFGDAFLAALTDHGVWKKLNYPFTDVNLEPEPEPEYEVVGHLIMDRKHGGIDLDKMITKVLYRDPATIIFWEDGTKTVVKCQGEDRYNPVTGFLLCIMKKLCGNSGYYNDVIRKHCPDVVVNGYTDEFDDGKIKLDGQPVSKESLLTREEAINKAIEEVNEASKNLDKVDSIFSNWKKKKKEKE